MTIERGVEAEQAVLGSLLISSECLGVVEELLRPEDFGLAADQEIYRAFLRLQARRAVMDPVTVLQELRSTGAQADRAYLFQLMEITPTAADVAEYARIVRLESVRRQGMDLSGELRQDLEAGGDPGAVLAGHARRVDELLRAGTAGDLYTPEEAMLAFYDHRQAVDEGRASGFLPTGYRDLDALLGGGMLASGLYILAARPGVGKTVFGLNVADRVAGQGGGVLFVSLEMDVEQLQARRIARETGIPAGTLLMRRLGEGEYAAVSAHARTLSQRPLYLNRRSGATVEDILSMARRVRGLRLVVVDYLGKVSPGRNAGRKSRYEYMTEISGALKEAARSLKVPLLVLCQLNREVTKRQDGLPQLSDLRDTGAVEQDADGVMFLHRPAQSGWGGGPAPTAVLLEKNRHGPTGRCELAFALGTCKVSAISGSAPPPGQWNPADGEDPFPDPCPQEAIKL